MRPSRHGVPPPVAMTSPDFSLRLSSASASSWRNRTPRPRGRSRGSSGPRAATIMSSVSTKQRPSRRASRRPHDRLSGAHESHENDVIPPHPRILPSRPSLFGEVGWRSRARWTGPGAEGRTHAAGSVTRSLESHLFEVRARRRGSHSAGRAGAPPGATRPSHALATRLPSVGRSGLPRRRGAMLEASCFRIACAEWGELLGLAMNGHLGWGRGGTRSRASSSARTG